MKNSHVLLLALFSWFGISTAWAQAPAITSVVNLDGGCWINVTAPNNTLGGVNTYQYSVDNGTTWVTPSPFVTDPPISITGLTNCSTYQVKVRASQWYGTSTASAAALVQPKVSTNNTSSAWTLQAAANYNSYNSVTYGNGLYVAVASTGGPDRIMTSPDGTTWTSVNAPGYESYNCVAYGNGTFVALATGTAAMTSADGITWTAQTLPYYATWNSITFAAGQFVAVCSGYPGVMYSSDGINWNQGVTSNYWNWRSVTYGNGKFVAVSDNPYGSNVIYSTDGINWTGVETPYNQWKSVTYGSGKFVAVCDQQATGNVMYSTDGLSWTSVSSSLVDNNTWKGITYGNGLFVAVASYSATKIMWSTDGSLWFAASEPANDQWSSICFGNGLFVAVASTGSYQGMVMTNSISFTAPPDAPVVTAATAGSSQATVYFTAPQDPGTSPITYYEYSTNNGSSWVNPSTPITSSPFTIAGLTSGGVRMRAVSAAGTSCASAQTNLVFAPGAPTIDSTDGISGGAIVYFTAPTSNGGAAITNYEYSVDNGATWIAPTPAVTASPLSFTGAIPNCTSGSVKLRAVNIAGSGAASASAGFSAVASQNTVGNFIRRPVTNGNNLSAVVFGNGIFVAVGNAGKVLTSPDGISWTSRTAANTNNWSSVTYGNGLFVAVANSGTSGQRVMTSPDGITWTARTVSQTRDWQSIQFGNGIFVATALGTSLGVNDLCAMVSNNGINWTLSMPGNQKGWRLVFGNGKFIAFPFNVNSTYIRSSTDGITWTDVPISSDGPIAYGAGAFGNGRFVLSTNGTLNGNNFKILYSSDGVNWNTSNLWNSQNAVFMSCMIYASGYFVAIPDPLTGTQWGSFKSTDGITWTQSPAFTGVGGFTGAFGDWERYAGIAYGNGRFVTVGNTSSGYAPVSTSNAITKSNPAPAITSITPYHTSCFVNFTASSSALSEPATNYQYSTNNGTSWTTMNPAVTASPFKISGLTNGTTYNIMIRSVSAGGNSCPSNTVSVTPVIGIGASAPVIDSVQNRDNSALVFFTPPTSDGGSPMTNYQYSVDSGATWINRSPVSLSSPINITGISNCNRYPIFIRAVNATGGGTVSNKGIANPRTTTIEAPTNWTQQTGPSVTAATAGASFWNDVAYGNGVYVVVGQGGGNANANDRVATSTDGVTWTKRSATAAISWRNVAFGNGTFVALGDQSLNQPNVPKVMTSPDGITWTARQSPLNAGPRDLIFANGKFVAIGYNSSGLISMQSTDGINWTSTSLPSGLWAELSYGNGMFIASYLATCNTCFENYTGFFMTSTDGLNWTVRNDANFTNYGLRNITYGAGRFVATGTNLYNQGYRLFYSSDGLSWTMGAPGNAGYYDFPVFGNGIFAVVNPINSNMIISTDGINWTGYTRSGDFGLGKVKFLNGGFIIAPNYDWNGLGAATTSSTIVQMASGGIFQVPDRPTINTITTSGGNGSIAFTLPTNNGGSAITNYEYSIDNGVNWITPSPEVTSSPLAMPGDTVGDILIRAINSIGASCPSNLYNLLACPPTTSSVSETKCPNELPYLWNNQSLTSAGTYTWTGVNSLGCDSIVTLVLTVSGGTSTYDTASACGSYTWSVNSTTYTQSGTYSSATSCQTSYLILSVTPQPAYPSGLACYQTATLNSNTCQWEVTGTQPAQPSIACYETATFNNTTCQWDVTGTQPSAPTGLACWQSATFNNTTCQWGISGTAPAATVTILDSVACKGGTAQLLITATGGTAPYTGDGVVIANAGTWNYTITDANGCTATSAGILVTEPSLLSVSVVATGTTCNANNGQVAASASGGVSPYSYYWNNGGTANPLPMVGAGSYNVTLTDAKGCTASASATVTNTGNLITATTGAVSGPTAACKNSTAQFSIPTVANATSYIWTLPAGATGTSTSNTITVSFGNTFSGGNICVKPSNSCNSGTNSCKSVTVVSAAPAQPGTITLSAAPCGPTTITCSVTAVPQATSYSWTVAGTLLSITGGQGTNSVQISVPIGFTNAQLSVTASNCLGTSTSRITNLIGLPSLTGPLTGSVYLCPNQSQAYSIPPAYGATGVQWTVTGNAQVVSSSGTSCTVQAQSNWTGGTLTATASNTCGTTTKSFTLYSGPTQPGGITGPAENLCYAGGTRTASYSIAAVTGASSYNWTVPNGMSITSTTNGGTGITVSISSGFTTGNVCVSAVSACGGVGQARCLAVTNRTAIPGAITGFVSVCKSQILTYTIAPVAGATSYVWGVTGGGSVTGTGTSGLVNFTRSTSSSVSVSVTSINACGNSNPSKMNVMVSLSCRAAAQEAVTKTTLYPNPSTGDFTLDFSADQPGAYQLELMDLLGQRLDNT
jgi:hypothetical protein